MLMFLRFNLQAKEYLIWHPKFKDVIKINLQMIQLKHLINEKTLNRPCGLEV